MQIATGVLAHFLLAVLFNGFLIIDATVVLVMSIIDITSNLYRCF